MKRVYKLDLGRENKEIKKIVREYYENGKSIVYILPSKFAVDRIRNEYIEEFGGISKLFFHTFDSFKRKFADKIIINESFKLYIVKKIIKNGNFKILKDNRGVLDHIIKFINKAREDNIKNIANTGNKLIDELGQVYKKYLEVLQTNSFTDLIENPESIRGEVDLIVVDGFFSFKEIDFHYLEKLSQSIEVLVNIPYSLKDFNYIDVLIKKFEDIGFESINMDNDRSIKDLAQDFKDKLFIIREENNFEKNKAIFKIIKKNLRNKIDIINLSENPDPYKEHYSIERLKFNNFNKKPEALINEFIDLLKFIENPNRENLLKRCQLKYFRISDNFKEISKVIYHIDFNNLDQLKVACQTSLKIEEEYFKEFYAVLDGLEKELRIKDLNSFEELNIKIENYLEKANLIIEEEFKIDNIFELYRKNLNLLKNIREKLDSLKKFREELKDISWKDYGEILIESIKDLSYNSLNYYGPSLLSMENSIYLKFDKLIIDNCDFEYPKYRKDDFIFNDLNNPILRKMGFDIKDMDESYENSLIRFLSLLNNTNTIYFTLEKDQEESIFLTYLKDIKEIKIRECSSVIELSLDLLKQVEEKGIKEIDNLGEKDLEILSKMKDYDFLNKRIKNEKKRKSDNKIILSGQALDLLRNNLKHRGFRATDFDKYIRSPYEFLYKELSGVKSLLDEYGDQYYLELGNLYHNILEKYFKKYPDKLDDAYLKNLIKKERVSQKEVNLIDNAMEDLIFQDLKRFIEVDLSEREGYLPEEMEKQFTLNLGDFSISGRIDRIDKLNEYKKITDYKSSSAVPISKIKNYESFQMPIYMLSEENVVEGRYGVIKTGKYSSVIRNKDYLSKKRNSMTTEEINALLMDSKQEILNIYQKIILGDFTTKEVKDEEFKDLFREIENNGN
ncbi:MAG: PD-(D/E)XK nuclease family protein [Peptoniphilaceae bacterium]